MFFAYHSSAVNMNQEDLKQSLGIIGIVSLGMTVMMIRFAELPFLQSLNFGNLIGSENPFNQLMTSSVKTYLLSISYH